MDFRFATMVPIAPSATAPSAMFVATFFFETDFLPPCRRRRVVLFFIFVLKINWFLRTTIAEVTNDKNK